MDSHKSNTGIQSTYNEVRHLVYWFGLFIFVAWSYCFVYVDCHITKIMTFCVHLERKISDEKGDI